MKFEELNYILSQRFPHLLPLIEMELGTFECYKPGPHVLYGNVLNVYVADLLRKDENLNEIASVFNFYEELAQSDDIEVNNLLQVTLLEYLWDDPVIYKNGIKYMLTETKKLNELIGAYLSKPE